MILMMIEKGRRWITFVGSRAQFSRVRLGRRLFLVGVVLAQPSRAGCLSCLAFARPTPRANPLGAARRASLAAPAPADADEADEAANDAMDGAPQWSCRRRARHLAAATLKSSRRQRKASRRQQRLDAAN